MSEDRRLKLRAVNWPKGFFVTGLVPEVVGAHGKARLRTLLSQQRIPRGSGSKHTNTIEFFDYTYDLQNLVRFEAAMPSRGVISMRGLGGSGTRLNSDWDSSGWREIDGCGPS